jgi:hypothetical protein
VVRFSRQSQNRWSAGRRCPRERTTRRSLRRKNASGAVIAGHPKRNQRSTETLLTNRVVRTNRSKVVKRYCTYLKMSARCFPQCNSEVKNAFELLYRSGLNVKQALEEAEKRPWGARNDDILEFRRNSETRHLPDGTVKRGQDRRRVTRIPFQR